MFNDIKKLSIFILVLSIIGCVGGGLLYLWNPVYMEAYSYAAFGCIMTAAMWILKNINKGK